MTSRDAVIWENLPEEELLTLHFTNSKDMDAASKLKQHDNVHKQIAAFEKLVQHSINRFSTNKLYSMLHALLNHSPYRAPGRAPHSQNPHGDAVEELTSLNRLRELVAEFRDPSKRGIEKAEQTHIVKYFEALFEDLAYLRSLKKYFDERVYMCLYDYFYDPEDDVVNARETLERERRGRVYFDDDNMRGRSDEDFARQSVADRQESGLDLTEESQEENELELFFDRLLDDEKLSVAVRKMFQLNERWDVLFQEGEIDPAIFDPDSKHEVLQYSDYEQFESILRLIPDIFVKAYKSVEVAKLWWTQAHKIQEMFPHKHSRRQSDRDVTSRIANLESRMTGLRDEIRVNEDLLLAHNDELCNLQDRETRYVNLSEQCETLEDRKNVVGEKYNKLLQYRDQLKRKLEKLGPRSDQHKAILGQLRDCDRQFFDAQVELRMLSFQFQLVQSDFLIELEIRPEIIRFQLDVNMKIEETKKTIQSKNKEVKRYEKRLVLLRTNCERMKRVIRKCIHSQSDKKPDKEDGKKLKKKAGDEKKGLSDHQTFPNVSGSKTDWEYYSDPQGTKTTPPQDKNREKNKDKKTKDKPGTERKRKSKSRENKDGGDPLPVADEDGNDADTETPTPLHHSLLSV